MSPILEKKKGKKVMEINRFNPSSRKNITIELEQIEVGTLRYRDGNFDCLIGIETEDMKEHLSGRSRHVTLKEPRRISRIKWSVHKSWKVGDDVDLSPRDIEVLDAILQYLKKMGYYIG